MCVHPRGQVVQGEAVLSHGTAIHEVGVPLDRTHLEVEAGLVIGGRHGGPRILERNLPPGLDVPGLDRAVFHPHLVSVCQPGCVQQLDRRAQPVLGVLPPEVVKQLPVSEGSVCMGGFRQIMAQTAQESVPW